MTSQNKIRLSLITTLLLGGLLFVFLIVPIYNNIKNGSQEIINQKQKLNSLESRLNNVEEFRQKSQEIEQNLAKAESMFIDSEAPVGFIAFLEQISQNYQVSIEIAPSIPIKEKGDLWVHINFQITSYSSFPRFLQFLEKIESSSYLIKITNLNINRLTEQELKLEGAERFLVGDVRSVLLLKVHAN